MATILLTGANGFVGSHTLPALIAAGHRVRALVRDAKGAERVRARLTTVQATSVDVVVGDIGQPSTLAPVLAGVDAVVHLVAIPRDTSGGADLRRVNTEGTQNVVAAMTAAAVSRLVHLGAMGVVDEPSLHYASSKAQAEAAVRASSLRWTILKPSLLWGERDGFFNIVASLVRYSPGVVPVAGGRPSRFQPFSVDELARVVVSCLERDDTIGHDYDLGGPEYWTYREMVAEVITAMGKKRAILTLPLPLIKAVARTSELLHLPFPVASDQLRQLAFDNAAGLGDVERDFGFAPRSMRGSLGYLRLGRKHQEPNGNPVPATA
jgi:uncharacterized protein YbjT (DUF2867 family)